MSLQPNGMRRRKRTVMNFFFFFFGRPARLSCDKTSRSRGSHVYRTRYRRRSDRSDLCRETRPDHGGGLLRSGAIASAADHVRARPPKTIVFPQKRLFSRFTRSRRGGFVRKVRESLLRLRRRRRREYFVSRKYRLADDVLAATTFRPDISAAVGRFVRSAWNPCDYLLYVRGRRRRRRRADDSSRRSSAATVRDCTYHRAAAGPVSGSPTV